MKKWFEKHGFDYSRLKFATKKPKCRLYIDDRGYHFDGKFPSVEFVETFKPWNKEQRDDSGESAPIKTQ